MRKTHGVPALAGAMLPVEGGSINGKMQDETASDRLKPGLDALCPSLAYEICGRMRCDSPPSRPWTLDSP